MSAKHSPGPWIRAEFSAKNRNKTGATPINSPGHWIQLAVVFTKVDGKRDEEGEANANLIETAPELLAALKGAVAALEAVHGYAPGAVSRAARIHAAKAVIAKAEGRA